MERARGVASGSLSPQGFAAPLVGEIVLLLSREPVFPDYADAVGLLL
jgi:hypothetical protein